MSIDYLKELQIDGVNGGLIVNVDGAMPEHLKGNLQSALSTCFQDFEVQQFTALCYSYWAKYGVEVN